MIKNSVIFSFILVLLVGCSSYEDKVFVCDCIYKESMDRVMGGNVPLKSSCTKEESKSLVFNESKRIFELEDKDLGSLDNIIFNKHEITNEDLRKLSLYHNKFKFNRISLKLKTEFGIRSDDNYENRFTANYYDYDIYWTSVYQCKNVERV